MLCNDSDCVSDCWDVGQFLPHQNNECIYRVCTYGNEPWMDENGNIPLYTINQPCPPGSKVSRTDFNQFNPCSEFDMELRCNGSKYSRINSGKLVKECDENVCWSQRLGHHWLVLGNSQVLH